jgi:hypothetical protein
VNDREADGSERVGYENAGEEFAKGEQPIGA